MASMTVGDMQIYTQSEISEAILIGQKLMYCFDMMFVLGPSEKGNSNCFTLAHQSKQITYCTKGLIKGKKNMFGLIFACSFISMSMVSVIAYPAKTPCTTEYTVGGTKIMVRFNTTVIIITQSDSIGCLLIINHVALFHV
jgi:hypothetical protein